VAPDPKLQVQSTPGESGVPKWISIVDRECGQGPLIGS
jgi:hypothetical protein